MDAYSRRSSSSTAATTRSPGGVNSDKPTGSCSVVAAGSVWETRMRSDEVKGGIKVFNGGEPEADHNTHNDAVPGSNADSPMAKGTDKRTAGPLINGGGKRKNWKSDQSSGDGPTAPISRSRSDQLYVTEKGPAVQVNKGKKEVAKKSLIQGRKLRSEPARALPELRKVKSESGKGKVGDGDGDGGGGNSTSGSAQLRKAKSQPENFEYEAAEKGEVESGSDGVCKELEVCEDKVITSSLDQEGPELPRKQSTEIDEPNGDDEEEYTEDDEEEENEDEEKEEEENKIMGEEIEDDSSEDIKEITMAEPCQEPENAATAGERRKESVDIEKPKPILSANAMKKLETKEKPKAIVVSTNVNRRAPRPAAPPPPLPPTEAIKHTTTTSNSNRVHRNIASPTPSKPVITNAHRTSTVHQYYAKAPASYEHERFPETQNELQNLVDLVMWRDVSRSAFVFGIGAFAIISSSYTRDLNISFITVISYLGLVYLAAIFLYRSIICRGYVDMGKTGNVVGEEEAVWLLKLVLPYLNEFLLKVKALFSGDPATTMKLAVLLFVTARCGSSITIWKMVKLGFFGVFTLPKICSSYSAQISAYGKFWVWRFRDAWDSCSHKKAVAFSIFALVWNLSSVVARIWAAFMLFVAFRYYQQSLVQPDDWEKHDGGVEATWHGRAGGPRRGRGPIIAEPAKEKKAPEV